MRGWLSARLIRLGRRIDPDAREVVIHKPLAQAVNVYNVSGDPADRARRIQEATAAIEALNRHRSVLPLHLR